MWAGNLDVRILLLFIFDWSNNFYHMHDQRSTSKTNL